jgi:fructose-bisphosphate aldolase class 1
MNAKGYDTAKKFAEFSIKEKSGVLYLDSENDYFSKLFERVSISNTEEARKELQDYIILTEKFFLYINSMTLTEDAYTQVVENVNEGLKLPIPKYLDRKGVAHGVFFETLSKDGDMATLKYNEYLSQKFKYYKDTLNAGFVKLKETVQIGKALINLGLEESIQAKAQRLANTCRRAQETGLFVHLNLEISVGKGVDFDKLFREYELILSEVSKAMSDNDVLFEALIYVVNIVGTSYLNQVYKSRRITHEEIVVRNFVSWKRCIVPAVPMIVVRVNENSSDSNAFLQACSFYTELGKIEMKGPWVVTFGVGGIAYGNSVEFWKGDKIKKDLASGLYSRRLEALKACMNGEFKPEMAKEATYEPKEVGQLIKLEEKPKKATLKIID